MLFLAGQVKRGAPEAGSFVDLDIGVFEQGFYAARVSEVAGELEWGPLIDSHPINIDRPRQQAL